MRRTKTLIPEPYFPVPEITRRPVVVHHALTVHVVPCLEVPHGVQLLLGHLNRFLEHHPGNRLEQRRGGQGARVGEIRLTS